MRYPQPQFSPPRLFALSGNTLPTPSPSALNLVNQTGAALWNALQSSTASSLDFQSYSTAIQGFAGNLQETGWNAQFQAVVKANQSTLPNVDVVSISNQIRSAVANLGVHASPAQIQAAFQSSSAQRQATAQNIAQSGVAPIENDAANQMHSFAISIGQHPVSYQTTSANAHLKKVFFIRAYCAELGLAADDTAVFATFTGAEPVAAAFAVLGLVFGALGEGGYC